MTRHTRRPRLALVALAFALAALPLAAADTGVKAVDAAFAKAIVAGDLDALMALYDKDAVAWTPGAPEARGHQAIRASFEDLLGAFTVKTFTFEDGRYETVGKRSIGWGRFTMTMVPKAGGAPIESKGRFTEIAELKNGKWVYTVDHASSEPAPAPPAAKKN